LPPINSAGARSRGCYRGARRTINAARHRDCVDPPPLHQ
jgi:hypothetical protein